MADHRTLITGGSGFIGTNLLDHLIAQQHQVLNVDISVPRCDAHSSHWQLCDICDRDALLGICRDFRPDTIVHLAARTDLNGSASEDYLANTSGVSSLLDVTRESPRLKRCLWASSKFVCRNGYIPQNDTDFCPDTTYGESKVKGERLLHEALDQAPWIEWCIMRPTSIWGPWFAEPYADFFMTIYKNRFFNIRGLNPPRQFGYVGNTVAQIEALMSAPPPSIQGQVFYLADYDTYHIPDWAHRIAMRMKRRAPFSVPYTIAAMAARAGDVLKTCGWKKPPLTSFRLKNMSADTSGIDLSPIKGACPALPYSIDDGVDATVQWMSTASLICQS